MKRIYYMIAILFGLAYLIAPPAAMAMTNGPHPGGWFNQFWVHQYNTDLFMFGLWCTVFVTVWGVLLGLVTDQAMKLTGLDLTSRETVEF